MDTQAVYNSLPADDIYRIERLEFLDEAELLHQLLQHYCITWAWKDSLNIGKNMKYQFDFTYWPS